MTSPSEKTPVLHIINGEFYAGAERVQDLLALRLPEFGYRVDFACLKDGIFAEKRVSQDSNLISLPMQSNYSFNSAFRVASLIRSEKYKLIHTHTVRAAMIGQVASLMTGVPMVHHVHSPSDKDTENTWRNFRNSAVEKVCIKRAARLVAVSNSLGSYLQTIGCPVEKISVVCNGVPVQEKKRPLFVQGEPLVVGTVALFRPRKGIEILLEAIARARRSGYDVRLHAVGPFETTEYESETKRTVARLGLSDVVTWTGFTQHVESEFSNMHVFALPSLFGEGMPMVVLEAMATGVPVISTYVEGIPEVISDGKNGLLVEAGNIDQFSNSIARLADGKVDLATIGDAGQKTQRERFSDYSMSKDLAALYSKIV